jgi:dolichol-phosphate mannosyltransferase
VRGLLRSGTGALRENPGLFSDPISVKQRLAGCYMNKTLVVVPTYNERENLPPLAQRLMGLPAPVDMLVVDDNSPDGTGKLADELAANDGRIHVLHRTEKNGLGRAYIAGFKWALEQGYEFVFELDGDLSHNPDDIPMFLEAAKEADLVLGSRYLNGIRIINWPLSRLMLSKSAAKYVQVVTGMPFTDPTGGYKCFRRRALQALNLDEVNSNGYSFQIEMTHKLWRQGLKVVEVPIIFTDRFQGHSKMSGHIVSEAFWMVWRLLIQNKGRRRPMGFPSQPPRPPFQSAAAATPDQRQPHAGSDTRSMLPHSAGAED